MWLKYPAHGLDIQIAGVLVHLEEMFGQERQPFVDPAAIRIRHAAVNPVDCVTKFKCLSGRNGDRQGFVARSEIQLVPRLSHRRSDHP